MNVFKEKETFTENIAFIGMSAAMVAALSVVSAFLPLSSFAIILFLPLLAALTTYYCKDKYLLLYVFASIGISLLTTAYDITVTLFDVTPAILTGSLFGYLLKKKIPHTLTILIVSLLKLGLNYLMVILLKAIYGIDIIQSFLSLLNLQNKENISCIVPTFIFAYALIQESISFLVITLNAKNIEIKKASLYFDLGISLSALCFLALGFGLSFVSLTTGYLLASIGIYLTFAGGKSLLVKRPWYFYLLLGLLLLVSFYLSAYFYSSLPKGNAILLFLAFFVSISLCEVVSRLLFKDEKGEEE